MNYYNEHDPHAVAWLRNLIAAGEIPQGEVDERDIQDVKAAELAGYTQCHFFAGVAGWPLALKIAGWPEDRPVWTASLPCQPFSVAGRRRGHADERHLWPVFFKSLLKKLRPDVCFGEQVSSMSGLVWFDGVSADLESEGYTVGALDLCAAGVSSPHIRQRLYWVGESLDGSSEGMGDAASPRHTSERIGESKESEGWGSVFGMGRENNGVGDAERLGLSGELRRRPGQELADGRPTLNAWDDYELRTGADGTTRRIEPGLECLVNGLSFKLADGRSRENASRSKILKGLGNAIVPPLAAEFIGAYILTCQINEKGVATEEK